MNVLYVISTYITCVIVNRTSVPFKRGNGEGVMVL